MNVLILGVDHEIQKVDAWRSEEMKTAYRDLLREIVGHYEVQFIGEEVGPDDETVGAQLTAALNLPFPWRNIDMPETARKGSLHLPRTKRSSSRATLGDCSDASRR